MNPDNLSSKMDLASEENKMRAERCELLYLGGRADIKGTSKRRLEKEHSPMSIKVGPHIAFAVRARRYANLVRCRKGDWT